MAVSLDGSARKLVTVRSALLLTNHLPYPVDIKLENVAVRLGGEYTYITSIVINFLY